MDQSLYPMKFIVGCLGSRSTWVLALAGLLAGPFAGQARDFRPDMLPNGNVFSCTTCHTTAFGGPRNAFGREVERRVRPGSRDAFWTPDLAALDSDGDGFTNGEELGDPEGDDTAIVGWKVTNPGSATSKPAVNRAPTVSITAPTEGATFTAPAISAVTAEASDPDGSVARVEFFSNGRLLGSVVQAPYSLMVDWALGGHAITAKATDNQGASTTSSVVTMSVNAPDAPAMGSARPADGNLEMTWTGGGGPFALQSKAGMTDPWCSVGAVMTNRSFTAPMPGAAGFYRVADLATLGPVPMTASLGGDFERPTPVTTPGRGSATFKVQGSTLSFDIEYSGLSGPATAAHIHGPAGLEEGASVLINLEPFHGGAFGTAGTFSGSVILTAEQKAAVLGGRTYVNVHTDQNRGGEIRGQILPVLMQAALNGANERPDPIASAGTATGLFLLTGDQLTFNVSYSGLSGPAINAHIHGPADAENSAGVLINLAPFNGGAFGAAGTLAGTVTLTPAQLVAVASGLTYVNIHTDAHRGGEIRGQILPCIAATPLSTTLSGAFERPDPIAGAGTGSGILAIDGDTLLFSLRYTGLSGPAIQAHIHGPSAASGSAGVLINLAPFNGGSFGTSGALAGRVNLTPEQRGHLLAGQTYVNVHTEANRGGEIRGQVIPALMTASLAGANERPDPVSSPGTGSGHFVVAVDRLWLNVTYRGLTGPATMAHVHGPADLTGAAGVLLNLGPFHGGPFGSSGSFAGSAALDAATTAALVDGLTYVNIHTEAHQPGEIRGQILRPASP